MADATRGVTDQLIKVTSPTGKQVDAAVRVQRWSSQEKTTRIWRRLGTWWGGAMIAAVVPPHIPWFTIGFLGGPVAAWLVSRRRGTVLAQELKCPDCGTPASIEEQPESWPLGARCESCRRVFWMDQLGPAPVA
jgi:hypothetical protein